MTNFIIANGLEEPMDAALFFAPEAVETIGADSDMYDVLVLAGVFRSRSEARKNWNGTRMFPLGFETFVVGKKKQMIATLRPMNRRQILARILESRRRVMARDSQDRPIAKPAKK